VKNRQAEKIVEVWFQDESRFGQQGTLTRVWALKGSRPAAVRQTEYQWVYLYGAVNPMTGESMGLVATTTDTQMFNVFLEMLGRQVGPERHVILILDRAGWHRAGNLKVPENITLHHLPPYSPELNPIERLWLWIKSHELANRVYEDKDELWHAGMQALANLDPERLKTVCQTEWLRLD
jgi:transposase